MKDKLLQIISFYKIDNQKRKFLEESGELLEAITIHELNKSFDYIETKEHIAEEIADVLVMLKQFQYYYGIEDKQIEEIMKYKIDRQLKRIDKENN